MGAIRLVVRFKVGRRRKKAVLRGQELRLESGVVGLRMMMSESDNCDGCDGCDGRTLFGDS